jgi:hypothetical protein
MRGGTFTDKYGTLLMSGAAVAVAVAAVVARRPRGYKGWYRGYAGAVRAKAQAQWGGVAGWWWLVVAGGGTRGCWWQWLLLAVAGDWWLLVAVAAGGSGWWVVTGD